LAFDWLFFGRKLEKIAENWPKSPKIGENQPKSPKILAFDKKHKF
jgi:hypothetical protein